MTLVLMLCAAWLLISPFVMSMNTVAAAVGIAAAIATALLALVRTSGPGRAYAVVAVGVALAVASLFLAAPARWGDLLPGLLLLITGAIGAASRRGQPQAPQAPRAA